MRGPVLLALLFLGVSFAGCLTFQDSVPPQPTSDQTRGPDDAVVIAVVDGGVNPYLWDFSAEFMPQHLNDDPLDDLPLLDDPAVWLPGHPGPDAFASYQALNLTLNTTDPEARVVRQCSSSVPLGGLGLVEPACTEDGLYEHDAAVWDTVERSTPTEVHMNYIPGTKVVGFVNFGSGTGFGSSSHGVGTSTVSAGNLHGTCPECLLVFVNGAGEAANEWVAQQDWIDVQTNSWGLSLLMRDRLYDGSDKQLQREASERGQAIFFSAGNGQANAFMVPNPTLFSSQEGPDWIVTVGAISPSDGSSYSGHGKPADISSVGSGYPSGGGWNVTSNSTFGGTSNATPVTAGSYARALYLLRREMDGPSRVQEAGIVSIATPGPAASAAAGCGEANLDCALVDGQLTTHELRASMFAAVTHTPAGWVTGLGQDVPYENSDMMYMAEGHGSFWGRLDPDADWWLETERIRDHAQGNWFAEPDAELVDWFVADSYCRQALHGSWDHGYYTQGATLPASDPAGHPVRTWLTEECDGSGKAFMDLVTLITENRP